MAKGEIACFEQLHSLSQCFQTSSAADASTGGKGLTWFQNFIFNFLDITLFSLYFFQSIQLQRNCIR